MRIILQEATPGHKSNSVPSPTAFPKLGNFVSCDPMGQVTAAVDNFLGVIDTAAQQLEQECNVCLDAYVKTKTGDW